MLMKTIDQVIQMLQPEDSKRVADAMIEEIQRTGLDIRVTVRDKISGVRADIEHHVQAFRYYMEGRG